MNWISREKVNEDRDECRWLIKKFIDPDAEFVFLPNDADWSKLTDEIISTGSPAMRTFIRVHSEDV